MDLLWKLRLLAGPMRPFIAGKLADVVKHAVGRFRNSMNDRTLLHEGLHTSQKVFPLPSQQWFEHNSQKMIAFASNMRAGKVQAYGIDSWHVGDVDPDNVDVRSVHELSRMHHWCAYALAAHIEPHKQAEWAHCFETEVKQFIRSYDRKSIHWIFPMGVALRVFSMLVAWDWIRRTGYEDADLDRLIAAQALEHGMQVYVNRESRGGLSTSHYSANLLGLLAVHAYVRESRGYQVRGSFVVKEIEREISRQILNDGMVQEASTSYHRHVVDLFTMMGVLLSSIGNGPSEGYADALRRAIGALQNLELIHMPLIGDNDDGMAMKLVGFEPSTDATYDYARQLGVVPDVSSTNHTSYRSFGLDVWRGELGITLRNGPVGQFGKGGHAHHDQNSITVSCKGHPIIVDPGTSLYTRSAVVRNAERAVHCHATMWPSDIHQGHIQQGDKGLFWLPMFDVQRNVLQTDSAQWIGEVVHVSGVRHLRSVTFNSSISVIDCVDKLFDAAGSGIDGVLRFPFDSGVDVVLHDNSLVATAGDAQIEIHWQGAEASLEDIAISHRFAETKPSIALLLCGSNIAWRLRIR